MRTWHQDTDVAQTARRMAQDVLFPTALAADAADVVPVERLDALAEAGFYGLPGPRETGGLDADLAVTCSVIEALASGCLTTTFVWAQHLGAVLAAAHSTSARLREEWLEPLCRGRRRAGLALAGVLPEPLLRARRADGGWLFSGTAPWVSGWGRIDVVHAAARDADDNVVWAFVDARESAALRVGLLALVAVNASATVRASFDDVFVPEDRVTAIVPREQWSRPEPAVLRIHASFALGLVDRCCRLIGGSPLDEELAACRAALDNATPETMPTARAAASELALRAAAAVVVSTGSRAVVTDQHAQRLAREALFLLVYGSRPAVRAALLDRLGVPAGGPE